MVGSTSSDSVSMAASQEKPLPENALRISGTSKNIEARP